jgi:hypothetical protein
LVDQGLLVGVTHQTGGHTDVIGIRVADGRQQWVTRLPDDVPAVRDDSTSVVDGPTTVVGVLPDSAFGDETAIHRSGSGFALVNSTGTNPVAPVSVVGR